MSSILDAVTGWTLYGALIAALGACAARWIIIPRAMRRTPESEAGPDVADSLGVTARRLALLGALLLVPAMALFFLRQLLDFRDPFVPWTEDADFLLRGTAWGTTWLWGVAGTMVACVGFGIASRGSRAGWWIGAAAALALGAFPAFTGHASGGDGPRALMLTADTLHVWFAGAWLGGLAFVLYAERRWRKAAAEAPDGARPMSLLPTLVPVFSSLAMASVAVLGVTGGLAAWVHVPNLAALTGSPYGRTLLLKLVLVTAVLALGFLNWRKLTPRLGSPEGHEPLRTAASIELLIMQAVLVVTALLVRSAPPMP